MSSYHATARGEVRWVHSTTLLCYGVRRIRLEMPTHDIMRRWGYASVAVALMAASFAAGYLGGASFQRTVTVTSTSGSVSTATSTVAGATITSIATTTAIATVTNLVTVTVPQSGACPLTSFYPGELNGSLSQNNLQVVLLGPPITRANFTEVLRSLNFTGTGLNRTYSSVTSFPPFLHQLGGRTWALQYWGPEVPGYTPPSNLTLTGDYFAIPTNYKPIGIFFIFGTWNYYGSATGTAYVTYSLSGNIAVEGSNIGPYGCLYAGP